MWHWRILGFLLLAIGGIGVVLPVLPTTIFWILAALCFARSDPKIRDWIYARPGFGPQVRLFIENGQMTRTGKNGALVGMALAAGSRYNQRPPDIQDHHQNRPAADRPD